MRFARYRFVFCLLVLTFSVHAQQADPSTTLATAQKDPQAVAVLNQALAVAGGANVISAIKDYTASGQVTFHFFEDSAGPVTVKSFGIGHFRLDASLPNGVRTHVLDETQIHIRAEDGNLKSYPPNAQTYDQNPIPPPSSDAFPYQPPKVPGAIALPALGLAAVTTDSSSFTVSYGGEVLIDSQSLIDIRVQRQFPSSGNPVEEYRTSDIFIDPTSFQVAMVQDVVPKHIVHQYRYADYRAVQGVLVPFSIREVMDGQETWIIKLDQITFNSGLQVSDFAL
jgi:hypothetical protein